MVVTIGYSRSANKGLGREKERERESERERERERASERERETDRERQREGLPHYWLASPAQTCGARMQCVGGGA